MNRIIRFLRALVGRHETDFIRHDQTATPLYKYLTEFKMNGKTYGEEIWAYSQEDADQRVKAMRGSMTVIGQAYHEIEVV